LLIALGSLINLPIQTARQRLFMIIIPISCIPFWIFSGSRGAWLSTILAISILLLLDFKRLNSSRMRTWFFGMGVLASSLVTSIFFTSQKFYGRLTNLFSDPIRTAIWDHYISLMNDHWLFGLSGYYQRLCLLPSGNSYGPHNIYLDSLVRYGLVGLTGWLLCFGWLILRLRKECWLGGYGKLAISGLVMILAAGFVDYSTYRDPILQAPLAMIIAVAFGHISTKFEEP
jgi:O-antigen ligase